MICSCTALTFVFLLFRISFLPVSSNGQDDQLQVKCVDVTIPVCKAVLPYNKTKFPNLLSHRRPQDAEKDFKVFLPILKFRCSTMLPLFLCSVYWPFCSEKFGSLPPCRQICERSKSECANIMDVSGFTWPQAFSCDQFPRYQGDFDERGNRKLCLGTNDTTQLVDTNALNAILDNIDAEIEDLGLPNGDRIRPQQDPVHHDPNSCPRILSVGSANETNDDYKLGGKTSCGIPCPPLPEGPNGLPDNWFFTKNQRDVLAPRWILGWSLLCLIATFLTVSTFLVDRQRFKYPERPIVFLSFSYFIISLIYIAGYASLKRGGSAVIACNAEYNVLYQKMSGNSVGCAIQFLVLYFFTIAAAMWWVILTLTWFLAAGLAWSTEAIDSISQYFHLVSWIIPAILTIVILSLQEVDGDYLSGVCFVGVQDLHSHNVFVLGPLLVFLLLGTFFLLAGFYSMFRIRSVMKHRVSPEEKNRLEKFMVRIGIFSVLYTVPAAIVVACLIYESANRSQWQKTQIDCAHNANVQTKCVGPRPSFNVFMLKYFMQVFVGITSGFWICSRKTFYSWQSAIQHLRQRRGLIKRSSQADLKPSSSGQGMPVVPGNSQGVIPVAEVNPLARHESKV